jgi:hypothetical protein
MAKTDRLPCIFCPKPRTIKRGEHVWDDWLNRKDGKEIHDPSTTYYYGTEGKLIRKHQSVRLDVTLDVVCDPCNTTWMSDLTTRTKDLLEQIIRSDRPRDFNELDIVTLTSFAFMKSAVLDWRTRDSGRKPELERAMAQVRAACVFVGASGFGPWQSAEVRALLSQLVNRGCPVIPIILPDAETTPDLPLFLQQVTWLDLRTEKDARLFRLASSLRATSR